MAIVVAALLVLACLTVLFLIHFHGNQGPSALATSNGPHENQISIQEDSLATPTESGRQELELASTTDLLFLGEECPATLDTGVSGDKDCMRAVEGHFLDRPAYTVSQGGIVPRASPFTFRTLFDGHLKDRELVIEALSRRECRLLEGSIRLDLRERCNAEAFYRYAFFAATCYHASRWREEFKPLSTQRNDENRRQNGEDGTLFMTEEEIAALDQMSRYHYGLREAEALANGNEGLYYDLRNTSRERLLRRIWLESSRRCPSYVIDGSLTPLDGSPPDEELLYWWSVGAPELLRKRLQHFATDRGLPSEWAESRTPLKPHELLEAIAARLGFEWKLIVREHVPGAYFDEEFRISKRQALPWVRHLREAFHMSQLSRSDAVLNAVQGVVGLRAAGYEADIKYIVQIICNTDAEAREKEYKDCATAIRDLELELDPQDMVALRTLDEIEAAALKLNIYQDY